MNGILNIYKEAGFTSHDVVAKLRGMFAFVIFDRRDRSLFAARDTTPTFPGGGRYRVAFFSGASLPPRPLP